MTIDDTLREIAVIDDDDHIQQTVSRFLAGRGYRTVPFITGRTAINMLKLRAPPVVLIDFGLPDLSGVEVYKEITQEFQPIFISGIIGYMDLSAYVKDTQLSRRHFMAKPLDADQLVARIDEFYELELRIRSGELSRSKAYDMLK